MQYLPMERLRRRRSIDILEDKREEPGVIPIIFHGPFYTLDRVFQDISRFPWSLIQSGNDEIIAVD